MFNIGVEGQYLVAMVTAAWAALSLEFLPAPLLVTAILLAAMLGGMAWAAIPGILKVKTGAHEVVTTIMLNGIAISLLAWAINYPLKFHNAPPGQNVDLRTDEFPDHGLVGDMGKAFGITPGAHLSWLLFLAIASAIASGSSCVACASDTRPAPSVRRKDPRAPAGSRSDLPSSACSSSRALWPGWWGCSRCWRTTGTSG